MGRPCSRWIWGLWSWKIGWFIKDWDLIQDRLGSRPCIGHIEVVVIWVNLPCIWKGCLHLCIGENRKKTVNIWFERNIHWRDFYYFLAYCPDNFWVDHLWKNFKIESKISFPLSFLLNFSRCNFKKLKSVRLKLFLDLNLAFFLIFLKLKVIFILSKYKSSKLLVYTIIAILLFILNLN